MKPLYMMMVLLLVEELIMDESKEYQDMMTAASEIRENWKWKIGDFLMHGRHIELVVHAWENETLLHTHLTLQPFREPYNSDKDVLIPLPRQDQLQPMIYERGYNNYYYHHKHFTDFMNKDENFSKFLTYEQLWLAFVMHEKYNKKWNGEEWV